MPRSVAVLPTAVLVAALAVPGAAHAAGPVAVSPAAVAISPLATGAPAIAGDAVAWTEAPLRLRIATPGGGTARTLLQPTLEPGVDGLERATLVADAGAVALDYQVTDGGNTGGDDHDPETAFGHVAGPPAGPLVPIEAEGDEPPLAAQGSVVASVRGGGVLLTDVAGGPARTLALPPAAGVDATVDALALSASAVAVLRSGQVVVLDRTTGQVVWTTTAPGASRIGLEADGTLDVATSQGSRYALATATQAAPVPQVVGTTPGVSGTPVVRDGRIAFAGTALPAGRERRFQVAVQGFDGTPAQRLGFVGPTIIGVDVRGDRVAWRDSDCVYVQALPGTAADAPPAGPCPTAVAEVGGPAPRVAPGRRVRPTVACVAAADACTTTLRLVAGARTVARTRIRVPAGAQRTAALRFPGSLPRRGTVQLRATTTDAAGRTSSRTLTYR